MTTTVMSPKKYEKKEDIMKDIFYTSIKYGGFITAVFAEFSNNPTLRSVSYGYVIPLGLSLALIFQLLGRRKDENIKETEPMWKITLFTFFSQLPLLILIVQFLVYGIFIIGSSGYLNWLEDNKDKEPSTYLTIQWFVFMGLIIQAMIWIFFIKNINTSEVGKNIVNIFSNPIIPFFFMITVLTSSMMNYQYIILKDFIVDG